MTVKEYLTGLAKKYKSIERPSAAYHKFDMKNRETISDMTIDPIDYALADRSKPHVFNAPFSIGKNSF